MRIQGFALPKSKYIFVQDLRANSFFIFIFTGETKGRYFVASFFIFCLFSGNTHKGSGIIQQICH